MGCLPPGLNVALCCAAIGGLCHREESMPSERFSSSERDTTRCSPFGLWKLSSFPLAAARLPRKNFCGLNRTNGIPAYAIFDHLQLIACHAKIDPNNRWVGLFGLTGQ